VIQQAVEASRPLIEAAHHTLHVTLPDESVYLYSDPARLAQVFGNLLNNSTKYTNPGGQIWIDAVRDGQQAVVTVADNGMGLAPDTLEKIFDMFTQLDSSLEHSQGGLGIGLTLVRRLVQMHGGSIEARSAGPGRGSQFVVRLPVATTAGIPAVPRHPIDDGQAVKRRILIVDDNRDAAKSLQMLLNIVGHDTLTTYDGETAINAIQELQPDVVLLDLGLPVIDGYEVARRVRAQRWGHDIVLIALTGWGQDEDRQRSMAAGFNGHLVKPVEYQVLTELLNSLPAAHTFR
jgi:CheY-like chemotaxis protein